MATAFLRPPRPRPPPRKQYSRPHRRQNSTRQMGFSVLPPPPASVCDQQIAASDVHNPLGSVPQPDVLGQRFSVCVVAPGVRQDRMEILALRRSVRAVVAGRLDRIPFAAPVDHLQVGAVEIVGLVAEGCSPLRFCPPGRGRSRGGGSPRTVLIDFSAGQEDAGQIAAYAFWG